jgi:hypothetical protein
MGTILVGMATVDEFDAGLSAVLKVERDRQYDS